MCTPNDTPSPNVKKALAKRIFYNIATLQKQYAQERLYQLVPGSPFLPSELSDCYRIFLKNTSRDLHKWHHYFPVYHRHFEKYRNRPVKIIEVGVSRGGSLKLWKAYFGPQAEIHGIDIKESCLRFHRPEEGIHVHIGDQADRAFLRDVLRQCPAPDIFIDDGGHTTRQQIVTFLECYPHISERGVYLCEDVHANACEKFIDSRMTFLEFAKNHIDFLYAWYSNSRNAFYPYLCKNPPSVEIPLLTAITRSLHFYDSIVVFERGKVCMPRSEIR